MTNQLAVEEDQEYVPIEVRTSVADSGTWAKRLTVSVPAPEVGKSYDSVLGELVGTLRVPGFRPGKVPKNYAEKLLGEELKKRVTADILSRAFRTALKNEMLDVIGTPKIEAEHIRAERGQELNFDVEVEVRPTFDLGNYSGLPVEQEEVEVFPEELQRELDKLAWRSAEQKEAPADAKLQERDAAQGVLTYSVDGKEIHREDDARMLLIDGHVFGASAHLGIKFLEGAKVGEKRTIEETLADSFPVESARGKKASIEFELKKIMRAEVPVMDDELAKKAGAKDLAHLKEAINDELKEACSQEVKAKVRRELIDRIVASSPFELPKRLVDTLGERMTNDHQLELQRYGIGADELEKNKEQRLKETASQAEKRIREILVLEALCKKENLEVTEEELDEEIVKHARARGLRAAEVLQRLEEQGELDVLRQELRTRKAVDFLVEQAEIKVVPRKPKPKQDCGHEHH